MLRDDDGTGVSEAALVAAVARARDRGDARRTQGRHVFDAQKQHRARLAVCVLDTCRSLHSAHRIDHLSRACVSLSLSLSLGIHSQLRS